jgi:hypothetical protein
MAHGISTGAIACILLASVVFLLSLSSRCRLPLSAPAVGSRDTGAGVERFGMPETLLVRGSAGGSGGGGEPSKSTTGSGYRCGVSLGPNDVFVFDGVSGFEGGHNPDNVCLLKPAGNGEGGHYVRPDLSDCSRANSVLYDPSVVRDVAPVTTQGYTRCAIMFRDDVGGSAGRELLQRYQHSLRDWAVSSTNQYQALLGAAEVLKESAAASLRLRDAAAAELAATSERHGQVLRSKEEEDLRAQQRRSQLAAAKHDVDDLRAKAQLAAAETGRLRNSLSVPTKEMESLQGLQRELQEQQGALDRAAEALDAEVGRVLDDAREVGRLERDAQAALDERTQRLQAIVGGRQRALGRDARNCPSARSLYARRHRLDMQLDDPWEDYTRRRAAGNTSLQWPPCESVFEADFVRVPDPPERTDEWLQAAGVPLQQRPGPEYLGCWSDEASFGPDRKAFVGMAAGSFARAVRHAHDQRAEYVAIARSAPSQGYGFTFQHPPAGSPSARSSMCDGNCGDGRRCGCADRFMNCPAGAKFFAVYKVYGNGEPYDYDAPVPDTPAQGHARRSIETSRQLRNVLIPEAQASAQEFGTAPGASPGAPPGASPGASPGAAGMSGAGGRSGTQSSTGTQRIDPGGDPAEELTYIGCWENQDSFGVVNTDSFYFGAKSEYARILEYSRTVRQKYIAVAMAGESMHGFVMNRLPSDSPVPPTESGTIQWCKSWCNDKGGFCGCAGGQDGMYGCPKNRLWAVYRINRNFRKRR